MKALVNGINISYDDVGTGPVLILIHGFPLNKKMWRPQMNKLPIKGYRIIALDLRGFGETDVVDGPYSMEIFADDIIGLMDHLDIKKAIIGGMSMGGYILLNMLERYPERIKAAIFITTRCNADDEAGKARRLQLAGDTAKFGPQVVADVFLKLLFSPGIEVERPKLTEEIYKGMVETDTRGLAGGLLAMRERKDYTPLLSTFNVQALAIGAEKDQAMSPDCAREIAKGISGCKLAIIPEAGHLANLEDVKSFNNTMLEFLASIG